VIAIRPLNRALSARPLAGIGGTRRTSGQSPTELRNFLTFFLRMICRKYCGSTDSCANSQPGPLVSSRIPGPADNRSGDEPERPLCSPTKKLHPTRHPHGVRPPSTLGDFRGWRRGAGQILMDLEQGWTHDHPTGLIGYGASFDSRYCQHRHGRPAPPRHGSYAESYAPNTDAESRRWYRSTHLHVSQCCIACGRRCDYDAPEVIDRGNRRRTCPPTGGVLLLEAVRGTWPDRNVLSRFTHKIRLAAANGNVVAHVVASRREMACHDRGHCDRCLRRQIGASEGDTLIFQGFPVRFWSVTGDVPTTLTRVSASVILAAAWIVTVGAKTSGR
jgi:hypothetical protein